MGQRMEDYAVLGDLQAAALVGRDGSVDWLCLPWFDSPAGAQECTTRRYRDHSLVLESEWRTPEGTVRVVDCMPLRDEAPDVVRVVKGGYGRVRMVSELRLRFDYGDVVPWVKQCAATSSGSSTRR